MPSDWDYILFVLAYIFLALIALRLLLVLFNLLYPFLIGCPINLRKRAGSGNWAVVTGATDGIGKAYAIQLGKKGFNVLLISRAQSRLDLAREEVLTEAHDIRVETFAFDFNNSLAEQYGPLIKKLKEYEVGVLVNNVGMFMDYPDLIHAQPGGIQKLTDLTVINTLPVVILSTTVLEQMYHRKAGIIINVSSSAALVPMKKFNIYSATKRFTNHLSACLRAEYRSKNIIIQTICPGVVATKMARLSKGSFLAPTPETFVKSALRTVGLANETTGYFAHQVQAEGFKFIPQFMMDLIVDYQANKMKRKFSGMKF